MSGLDSDDGFWEHNLSDFTEEDFARIDAAIASASRVNRSSEGVHTTIHSGEQLTESQTIIPDENNAYAEVSFQSDTFDLNLGTLTAEDYEKLESGFCESNGIINGGPSIQVEMEDTTTASHSADSENILDEGDLVDADNFRISPLTQFRSWTSLSVTDLVSPAWCEVQYDYGLRGKRSRPISQRPRSFTSASGKVISPSVAIVQKNDIITRQGRAVHKQLEREMKVDELQVDITTEETRWALRLVNMIACLQGAMAGITREMPVFGIIHGEVVIGIMDEVCKMEVTSTSDTSPTKSAKRPAESACSMTSAKKARTQSPSQTKVDSYFGSPKRTADEHLAVNVNPVPESQTGYLLGIKDHKTRNRPFLPSELDMFPSRLQLMTYRRLLSELIARDPPYDFKRLWETIGVDPKLTFPTKFLLQARLIQDTHDFPSTCLDDLVAWWRRLLDRYNILGVDTTLELIYHLRPAHDIKGKRKAVAAHHPSVISEEDADLAMAIALSLESSTSLGDGGSSTTGAGSAATKGITSTKSEVLLQTEDAQLQWALQQSVSPSSSSKPPEKFGRKDEVDQDEDDGIRSFKIIGSKRFLHDDQVLDDHLNRVMQWWRGEREPEGVPVDRTYRCNTCEYYNDCEWRAQKALEFSKRSSSA